MDGTFLAFLPGLLIWISILILPWRPWGTRESLDSQHDTPADISDVTVLIPARNEAATIAKTLSSLKQGTGLKAILVDDQSSDDTALRAKSSELEHLSVISGIPLDEGWSGKLWALEQGRQHVKTNYLLLLDADIVLTPAIISTLLNKAQTEGLQMVSLMAHLKMESAWEKLLMPAFIFFFKLLYPFHLSNKPGSFVAAAAGGCILLETSVLEKLGGFSCIKNALIDDCSLARQVKKHGYKTWLGLTHSATSIRDYDTLKSIWLMVRRTAYTQLAYSPLLLLLCTVLMVIAFLMPLLALLQSDINIFIIGLLTIIVQVICYLPVLRYYSMPPIYALSLSLVGIFYLLMTWSSALHYYFGKGANWKGRHYQ